MDWTKILQDAGVPESPGRLDALRRMNQTRRFKATVRSASTKLLRNIEVDARDYSDALIQVRGMLRGHTLVRLAED